jgi:hypothetical protein
VEQNGKYIGSDWFFCSTPPPLLAAGREAVRTTILIRHAKPRPATGNDSSVPRGPEEGFRHIGKTLRWLYNPW